ncbi:MAG: hypothetical protein WC076_04835 [Terrimicrobiaceae bacterium]
MTIDILREDIALKDRALKCEPIDWIQGDPGTEGSHRVAGAALRNVHVGKCRPAECPVDEEAGIIGNHKLRIGGDLAQPDGDPVIQEVLLKPKIEQAKCVEARDIRNREEISRQILAGVAATQQEPRRADGRPLPSDGLFQIDLGSEIQKPRVNRPGLQAAGRIPPNFHRIPSENFHAMIGKDRSHTGPVSQDLLPFQKRCPFRLRR